MKWELKSCLSYGWIAEQAYWARAQQQALNISCRKVKQLFKGKMTTKTKAYNTATKNDYRDMQNRHKWIQSDYKKTI